MAVFQCKTCTRRSTGKSVDARALLTRRIRSAFSVISWIARGCRDNNWEKRRGCIEKVEGNVRSLEQ